MNEYCDLSPAERELLALVRSDREFSVTITRLYGVSTVKRIDVRQSLSVEGQAADFGAAWSIAQEAPEHPPLRLVAGGRADGTSFGPPHAERSQCGRPSPQSSALQQVEG